MTANNQSDRIPAAVLWTGGKDSTLALTLSRDQYDVRLLATFAPDDAADFKAHPLTLMRAQAESLDIEHRVFPVTAPYRDGYINALAEIAATGVTTVITGDIAAVDGHPNWIVECSDGVVQTHLPLWDIERQTLLQLIKEHRIDAVISLAYTRFFRRCIAGESLNASLMAELTSLAADGVDPCGENGEYHSSVLNAPGFRWPLTLNDVEIEHVDDYWRLTWSSVSKANANAG